MADTLLTTSVKSAVRDKINLATKSGPSNDRRNTLRAELDGIREKQMSNKTSRGKLIDQIKALQEGIQKKVFFIIFVSNVVYQFTVQTKDLQASKSKIPFRTTADLEAHVKFVFNHIPFPNY